MKRILDRLVAHSMANTLAHVAGFAIIVALVLSFDWGILGASRNAMQENGRRVSQLRDLIQTNADLRNRIQQVRHQIATEVVDVKPQDLSWVTQSRESEFLAEVSRIALEFGLKIDSFQRGQKTTRENMSTLQITMYSQGDFASLYQVIKAVEHLPFLVRVNRCQIDNTRFESRVKAEVVFVLYYDFKPQFPVDDKVASTR